MLRDSGPKHNLGFGIPLQSESDIQSGDSQPGNSNFIQRALTDSPTMRFFSVAAASLVSMHVAGKLVKSGGIRLADVAQEYARRPDALGATVNRGIQSFRKVQRELDLLEGISREYVDPANPNILIRRTPDGRGWETDKILRTDSYHIRHNNPNVPKWLLRDEVQQRMVRQARRLPYELPGFYAADKLFIEPILGDDARHKVDWSNPVDVLGDFAYKSVQNVAINVLPFDAGVGGARHAYRKLATAVSTSESTGMVQLRTSLELVGADATDLINRTVRLSNQTLGAFSQLVQDASDSGQSISQLIKTESHSAQLKRPQIGNSNAARRAHSRVSDALHNKDLRKQSLDALPGPFKGMGTALALLKQRAKDIGQTYDDWQNIVSGRLNFNRLEQLDGGILRAERVRAYAAKGGGTYLEQLANASYNLGRNGPTLPNGRSNPDWKNGQFFRQRSSDVYNSLLIDALVDNTGLTHAAASQFVRNTGRIAPFAGSRSRYPAGQNLIERIQFGTRRSHAGSEGEWWNSVVRGVHKHGIPFDPEKLTLESFRESVRSADLTFSSNAFKELMERNVAEQWQHLHGNIIPRFVGQSMSTTKMPYENFSNSALGNASTRQLLVTKTARRLGISVVDETGQAKPLADIRDAIRSRGLNPNNPHQLRGFLVDQKEINVPWARGSGNIFGIRAMTIQEGMSNGYFAGSSDEVQKEIAYLVNSRTHGVVAGRGAGILGDLTDTRQSANLGRVYVNSSGNVIDLGRMRRSVMATMDTLASDTQVPLLHFNPLQLGFYKKFQQMRNSPAIRIASTNSLQAPGVTSGQPDFLAFVKRNARSSKGSLFGVTGNELSGVTSQQIPGVFRPAMTNVTTMGSRYSQLFVGQTSIPSSNMYPIDEAGIVSEYGIPISDKAAIRRRQRLNKIKRRFDVSYDQSESLLFGQQSFVNRFIESVRTDPNTGMKRSLRNPLRLARAIADRGGITLDSRASAALDDMGFEIRNASWSKRLLENLLENSTVTRNAFDDVLQGKKLFEIPDSQLPGMVENLLARDLRVSFTDEATRRSAGRLQGPIKALLEEGKSQNSYWQLQAPNAARTVGISRRIDQLRAEMVNYMIGTSGLRLTDTSFSKVVSEVMSEVESLYKKGIINAAERSEARTAVLSLQLENAKNSAYNSIIRDGIEPTALLHNQRSLDILMDSSKYADVQELMREYSSGNLGHPGRIRKFFRKNFAASPYEMPYEVNPFGSSVIFEPTIGTAFKNNPTKAVAGILGASWDEAAYSSGAMPATHLVMRLNRYFETFGLGVDPSNYRSPIDMFARGMVGKRVLPAYAIGATAYSLDASLGGMVKRDEEGERVYSPLVMGYGADILAAGQIGLAGLIPGGQTAAEKREELFEGQVPIRRGRYWLLGNTPFKGDRIQYFRPSWYQRFKSGSNFTPEMNETPMERLLFGYDFSPLRPWDPYRFERQNAETRPYPISGDYFTGPFGPVTPALNATVGRLLKPRRQLASDEQLSYAMQQYLPVGDGGAYYSQTPVLGDPRQAINSGYANAAPGDGSASVFYPAMGYAAPRGRGSQETRARTQYLASMYSEAARRPGSYVGVYSSLMPYGVPEIDGNMSSRVISSEALYNYGGMKNQARRFGYTTQEMAGIYGFGFSSLRERFGLGSQDLTPSAAMLQPASQGYSSARSFWNLNLGGMGDLPLPIEGQFANLEISEIIRRFVPREPNSADYINPLPNAMGREYPWLPGTNYPLAPLKTGDPYSTIDDATLRLPGTGFRRTNMTFGNSENMSMANIHQILGDVAPWSPEYSRINTMVDSAGLSDMEQALIERTRLQVEAKRYKNEFSPYEYKYQSPIEAGKHPFKFAMGRSWEWLSHRDTFFNRKFLPVRTAVEDWERDNVYGSTYPQWQTPIESFIEPMFARSTQRDLISGPLAMGTVGSLFGVSHKAKLAGSVLGGFGAFSAGVYGQGYEAVTGNRYIPGDRRKELALEEYIDILSYVKAGRNATAAAQAGDLQTARQFAQQATQTMYGANLNTTPEALALTLPKRKREHFQAMLYAPEEERGRVLSTAGRLERRLYQAAWGMDVEQLPDLAEYFEDRELPSMDSSFWDPSIDMDTIKIKIGQSLGIDMAQMGYFPQQVREANLINPIYPEMFNGSNNNFSMLAQIQRYLFDSGIGGSVDMISTPFGDSRVQLDIGTY